MFKARNRETGEYVAIKKFRENEDDEYCSKIATREINILKQLRHDHIVELLEWVVEDKQFYLVFE